MSIKLLVAKDSTDVMQRNLWRIADKGDGNTRLSGTDCGLDEAARILDCLKIGALSKSAFETMLAVFRLKLGGMRTYNLCLKDGHLWAVGAQHMSLQERHFMGMAEGACDSNMLTRWEYLEAAEGVLMGNLPAARITSRTLKDHGVSIEWRKFLVCVSTGETELIVIVYHAGKQLKVTHIVPRDCPTLKDVIARLKKLAKEIKGLDDMLFIDKARIEMLLEQARRFDDEENPFLPVGTRAKVAAEIKQDVNSQEFNEAYDDVLKHM